MLARRSNHACTWLRRTLLGDSGDVVIIPKPGFFFFPKRHWQRKFDDVTIDLRLLEATYNSSEELTVERAQEVARAVENFFKTCRELADWISEETALPAIDHIHRRVENPPSALKVCDAIAQTAKHRNRSREDDITAVVTVYRGENGAQSDIAWSTPRTELQTVDALELAHRCVNEWRTYIEGNGLDMNGGGPPVIDYLTGELGRITDGRQAGD